MGVRNIFFLSLLVGFLCANLISGSASKPVDRELTVEAREWWELGGEESDPVVFSPVSKGDELYNGYGSVITVKSVNDDRVVLAIDGCLVEPNKDGTINLNKEPLKSITLEVGESIELVSQTMDAGVHVTLAYE